LKEEYDILIVVIIVSLILLIMVYFVLVVMVNSQRSRWKHEAEKVALEHKRSLEVERAGKEAVQNTLNEVGRELHDNVGQLLTAAQLGIMNHFGDRVDGDVKLKEIVELLEESIDEVSRMGRAMNSDFWKTRDLFEAINIEAQRLERLRLFVVHLKQKDFSDQLSEQERTMLFRAFQEVIRNAMKHSKAHVIEISMQSQPFQLIIADNGVGFSLENEHRFSGIANIKHRTSLVGIEAEVESNAQGTTWKFTKS
jgi:signal transduction histidine kinase